MKLPTRAVRTLARQLTHDPPLRAAAAEEAAELERVRKEEEERQARLLAEE
jgi:hypothetical protein